MKKGNPFRKKGLNKIDTQVSEIKAETDPSETQVPESIEPASEVEPPQDTAFETTKQTYSDIFEQAELAKQPEPVAEPEQKDAADDAFVNLFIGQEKPAEEAEEDTTHFLVSEPAEPTQEQRERIAGLETQVICLDDTEETVTPDLEKSLDSETEELEIPDIASPAAKEEYANGMADSEEKPPDVVIAAKKPGLLSRAYKLAKDTIFRTKAVTEDLEKQAAEAKAEPKDAPEESPASGAEAPQEQPEKKSIVSRMYTLARNTVRRSKAVTEDLEKQAAEAGSAETPETVPASVDEAVAETASGTIPEQTEVPAYKSAEPEAPEKSVVKEARAYITIDDHASWLSDLETADKNYKNAKGLDVGPAKQARDALFEKYASADSEQGVKDKRTLVYVLSELADAYQDAGKFSLARVRAGCAEKQAKALLKESPTADNLCLWGMVKHNLGVYKKEMIAKRKGA